MNCREFRNWLDGGKSAAAEAAAHSHAVHCAGCRRELGRFAAVEAALAEVSTPTAPGFASSVMARVARTPQVGVVPALIRAPESLPWWVQAASHPSVVLAFVILALLLWQGDALVAAASGAGAWLGMQAVAAGSSIGSLGETGQRIYVSVGLVLGFSPLLVLLYLGLYRGSLKLMLRISGRAPFMVHH